MKQNLQKGVHFELFDVSSIQKSYASPRKNPRNSFFAQKLRKCQGSYMYPPDQENSKQAHKSLSQKKKNEQPGMFTFNEFLSTTRPHTRNSSSQKPGNQFIISNKSQRQCEKKNDHPSNFSFDDQSFNAMRLTGYKRLDKRRNNSNTKRRETKSENHYRDEESFLILRYENSLNIQALRPNSDKLMKRKDRKSKEWKQKSIETAQSDIKQPQIPMFQLGNTTAIRFRSPISQKMENKMLMNKTFNLRQPRHDKLFTSPPKKVKLTTDYFGKVSDNFSIDQNNKMRALYYRDFIWKIWFNSGWKVKVHSYQNSGVEPPRFFIGKGNNSKLVRRIMGKRWWWKLESKQENANFLWTQLKIYSAYQSQKQYPRVSNFQEQDQNESLSISLNLDSKVDDEAFLKTDIGVVSVENDQNEVPDIQSERKIIQNSQKKPHYQLCKNISDRNKKGDVPKNVKKIQFDKNVIIMTHEKYKKWEKYISNSIYNKKQLKANENLESRLALEKQIKMQVLDKYPQKVTNHLQYSRLIGNKKALYKTMSFYYEITKRRSMYLPLTYHIISGLEDNEYLKFLNQYYRKAKEENNTMWIVKPGEMSNRGCGIQVCKDIHDIKKIIKHRKCHSNGKPFSYIIQQYLREPFLYEGRKFDIRHYMMISSSYGRVRGYWYQEGYLRTTSYKYSTKNNDPYVHLTNDAVQKNCKDYGKYEKGNKVSYEDFEKYLQSLPEAKQKGYSFYDKILPKIRQITIEIMQSCYYVIDSKRKGNNFEIFGLDIMVDADLRPWLIEVNTNPCLELSSPVLSRIIPSMLDNAFAICLDPLFPPPLEVAIAQKKNNLPDNYVKANKFQLVFDEIRDGNKLNKFYDPLKDKLSNMDGYGSDQEAYESVDDDCDADF